MHIAATNALAPGCPKFSAWPVPVIGRFGTQSRVSTVLEYAPNQPDQFAGRSHSR